jgi:hypothetical protein
VNHTDIEYQDGTQQVHAGPWSEARELADRAGLDHREDAGGCYPVESPRDLSADVAEPGRKGHGGQQQPVGNLHRGRGLLRSVLSSAPWR